MSQWVLMELWWWWWKSWCTEKSAKSWWTQQNVPVSADGVMVMVMKILVDWKICKILVDSAKCHSECWWRHVDENLVRLSLFIPAVEDLYETPSDLWVPGVAGPKFDKKSKARHGYIMDNNSLHNLCYIMSNIFILGYVIENNRIISIEIFPNIGYIINNITFGLHNRLKLINTGVGCTINNITPLTNFLPGLHIFNKIYLLHNFLTWDTEGTIF